MSRAAVAAVAAAATAVAVILPTAPAVAGPPLPAPARLQVVEKEFRLGLSRLAIDRGPAIVGVVNFGQDPHDLVLQRRGHAAKPIKPIAVQVVAPGGHFDLETRLAPGTYDLYCSLPGHRDRGMRAVLVVRR